MLPCFSELGAQIFRKVLYASESFISGVFCDWEHSRGYQLQYSMPIYMDRFWPKLKVWVRPLGYAPLKRLGYSMIVRSQIWVSLPPEGDPTQLATSPVRV